MPRGTYVHADAGRERFHCAPGPGGWRYVSDLAGGGVDLTVDSRWRQIRVQVTAGDWMIRGGLAGPEALWVRSGSAAVPARGPAPGGAASAGDAERAGPAEAAGQAPGDVPGEMPGDGAGEPTEHAARAAGFLGDSPGFLVAVARSLDIAEGERAEVPLVALTGPSLAAITVLRRWELAEVSVYETELAPLRVERYEVTDLATGERGDVHLAGDVVLDAPGIELAELDSPPTGVAP